MNHCVDVAIRAVAVLGPGLPDWTASEPILTGVRPYRPEPFLLPPPVDLSPAERRRAIPSVKLALAVASAAIHVSGYDPKSIAAVFASSGPDGETIDATLCTLATPGREVSPTRFSNSTHNAAAGYWGLATQSQEAATSVCGYDATLAVGLLEAATQVLSSARPILFVAYDLPYPGALNTIRPILGMFGVAFVLAPTGTAQTLGRLRLGLAEAHGDAPPCTDPGLEALRRGIPAARSLPLLISIARKASDVIRLDMPRGALIVEIEPC